MTPRGSGEPHVQRPRAGARSGRPDDARAASEGSGGARIGPHRTPPADPLIAALRERRRALGDTGAGSRPSELAERIAGVLDLVREIQIERDLPDSEGKELVARLESLCEQLRRPQDDAASSALLARVDQILSDMLATL